MAAAILAAVLLLAVQVRTDMAEFLPAGQSAAARLVLAQAREGSSTGLLLVAIEGAPPAELARISRSMAAALPATGLFALVAGGAAAMPEDAATALFAHRYLLSPVVTPQAFTEPALRAGMTTLLAQLQSSLAPLAVQFGLADPIGAFPALLRGWAGASPVRMQDGAWFAANRPPGQERALMLARTHASGMDIPGQEAATASIQAAFSASAPGPARLLLAGPGVFARDAARAIKADVERISLLSTVLVALLLWWRFRRPLVIAAIAVPVVLSIACAALAVQLIHGSLHGVALGFGITMLGVSVDYPVLMIGHRKAGEAVAATRARIGQAFILTVITAALGLAAMVFSGFPGLSQLGLFSAIGLVTAALVTWFVLPRLMVAADLAPVSAGDPAWLPRLERIRRWRLLGLLPVAAAALYLVAHGGPTWEGDLQSLSPVPAASRALDQELRGELGAAEVSQLLVVRGADMETVLRRQEALIPVLDALVAQGVLSGSEMAARLLPSAALQEARRAALPPDDELARRVAQAQAGLPFRPDAFAGFLAAIASTRQLPPVRLADFANTPIGVRLEPLLFPRDGEWVGPIALQGVRDAARLRAAINGSEGTVYLDMRQELGAILAGYTAQAWRWLGWSGLLVLLVLSAGLRQPRRVARVVASVGAALLVAVALLTVAGVQLSLIHLVALQLVAGVGLDYALFFARRLLDTEERARTLRTLVTCNCMTLLTFGLLALCQTPLLRDIGMTVALGAVLAMGFAFLFAGEAPARRPPGYSS